MPCVLFAQSRWVFFFDCINTTCLSWLPGRLTFPESVFGTFAASCILYIHYRLLLFVIYQTLWTHHLEWIIIIIIIIVIIISFYYCDYSRIQVFTLSLGPISCGKSILCTLSPHHFELINTAKKSDFKSGSCS